MDSLQAAFSKAPIDLYYGIMKETSEINCSLQSFFNALREVKLPHLAEIMECGILADAEHADCGHEDEFVDIIEEAIGRLAQPVTSAHSHHLSQQFRLRETLGGGKDIRALMQK